MCEKPASEFRLEPVRSVTQIAARYAHKESGAIRKVHKRSIQNLGSR